jgi:hypothetical protein
MTPKRILESHGNEGLAFHIPAHIQHLESSGTVHATQREQRNTTV